MVLMSAGSAAQSGTEYSSVIFCSQIRDNNDRHELRSFDALLRHTVHFSNAHPLHEWIGQRQTSMHTSVFARPRAHAPGATDERSAIAARPGLTKKADDQRNTKQRRRGDSSLRFTHARLLAFEQIQRHIDDHVFLAANHLPHA